MTELNQTPNTHHSSNAPDMSNPFVIAMEHYKAERAAKPETIAAAEKLVACVMEGTRDQYAAARILDVCNRGFGSVDLDDLFRLDREEKQAALTFISNTVRFGIGTVVLPAEVRATVRSLLED